MSAQCTTLATNDVEHAECWDAYRLNPRSDSAKARLIEALLPFVNKVLRQMLVRVPSHVAPEDLLQAGAIAMCHAVERYNPERGVSFQTFAYTRVRGAILDQLRAQDRVPRSCRERLVQVEDAIREYTREYGCLPSEDELAAQLGVTCGALNRLLDQARPWLSLDELLDGGTAEGMTRHELLADAEAPSPARVAERQDLCRTLRQALLQLLPREQKILYLYYYEDLRLSEIAALYELTEARISQIHAIGLAKLRVLLGDALNG